MHESAHAATYDLAPTTTICGHDGEVFAGTAAVTETLARTTGDVRLLVVECYPGVDEEVFEIVRNGWYKRRRQTCHAPALQAHGTIVVDVCTTSQRGE